LRIQEGADWDEAAAFFTQKRNEFLQKLIREAEAAMNEHDQLRGIE